MALGRKEPKLHIIPSVLGTIVATRLTLSKYTEQFVYHVKVIFWISFEACSSGQNWGLQGLAVFSLSSFIVFSIKSARRPARIGKCAHNPLKQKAWEPLP